VLESIYDLCTLTSRYEKYDTWHIGKYGGGGEYVPQAGFGWTNGVALVLLDEGYGSNEPAPATTSTPSDGKTLWIGYGGYIPLVVGCLAALAFCRSRRGAAAAHSETALDDGLLKGDRSASLPLLDRLYFWVGSL
jgi:hypothetical protein